MLIDETDAKKNTDVFPFVENILHFGMYLYRVSDRRHEWTFGMHEILGIAPGSKPASIETLKEFILPEDREKTAGLLQEAFEKGTPYQTEFSLLDTKGIYKRVSAESRVLKNAEGEVKEHQGIFRDITESFFYKKALEQKVVQLDKTNKNLQEFVYVASHDLQEPLRKISTFTERLKNRFETQLGDEGTMYVNRILNSGTNMQTLLEDLLNFSRLSSTDKDFETVSMQNCIQSVINDFEIKIEETGARIMCDPLPEIQGYTSQLRQLFSNLIGNSIKFRKQDEAPQIQITCKPADKADYKDYPFLKGIPYYELHFSDNGIGFEQEFAEKIFMIFQRLNGKAEYAGSGIGLSICKRIVENHHGFIFARGVPGEGSEFTVLLPVKQY